jgi:trehalose-phosphatase
MRDALRDIQHIVERVSRNGCVLMLDFDGTLAPIVSHPDDATLPEESRRLLESAVKHFPVAIISGRSLSDIRKRVGVRRIVYAGSHGHEWQIGARRYKRAIFPVTRNSLKAAAQQLSGLSKEYPRLISERKYASFAINYRTLAPKQARAFRRMANLIVQPYLKRGKLLLMDSMRTFEIHADSKWTKGHCADLLYKKIIAGFKSKMIPVFIGDSATDENVFKMLRNGISIRVGKSVSSAAKYYLRGQKDVYTLIHKLIEG